MTAGQVPQADVLLADTLAGHFAEVALINAGDPSKRRHKCRPLGSLGGFLPGTFLRTR